MLAIPNNLNFTIFMRYIKLNIATLSLIVLTSCSNMSDLWFGDDKKDALPGERIIINPQTFSNEVDQVYNKALINIPPAQNIDAMKRSTGVDSTLFPNLKLASDYKESKKFSFHGSKKFSSITPPILFDDKIVILETTGTLLAYDLTSGKKLWKNAELKKNTNSGIINLSPEFYQGGLTFQDNVIYATSGLNKISAIDAENGASIWSKEIASPTRATPLLVNGFLFIQTLDNSTYALDSKSGNVIWTHYGVKSDVSTVGVFSPLFSNNILIVQYNTGEIIGLAAMTGDELWTLNTNSGIERLTVNKIIHSVIHKIILDETMLIAYDNEGLIANFDLKTGTQLWSKDLDFVRPLWSCGELLIGINEANQLIALNKYNGKIKWQTNLTKFEDKKSKHITVWLDPLVANSKVLVVNSQGQLLEFDINTGEKILEKEVVKNVFITPIIVNERLYLVPNEGKIIEYS